MAAVTGLLWGITLLLAATRQGALASWWMDEPYGNEAYNVKQLYTENVTLECRDELVPNNTRFEYWFRPDLTVMRGGDSEFFWTLDGYAGWQVSADGLQMHVIVLQEEQFGFYHCVVSSDANVTYVIKKAINYKGPYFGDLWPKYRMNTIIGCSAAGGFLVLALAAMLIYHFRFQDDDDDDDDDSSSRSSVASSATSGQSPSTSSGSHGEWTPEHDGKARHRKGVAVVVDAEGEVQKIPATNITYVNVGFSNQEELDTRI